jgi:hypothetical protein
MQRMLISLVWLLADVLCCVCDGEVQGAADRQWVGAVARILCVHHTWQGCGGCDACKVAYRRRSGTWALEQRTEQQVRQRFLLLQQALLLPVWLVCCCMILCA